MATPRIQHLPAHGPVAQFETPATPFRESIVTRSAEFAAAHPYAVDLEARALAAGYPELRGCAIHLRGLHSETVWREILLGIKHGPEADLARLITSPMREAKAYARAKLAVYAAALGCRLVPFDPQTIDAVEVVAGLSESAGSVVAGALRALDDGAVTPAEAEALEPVARKLDTFTSRFTALLHRARRGPEARA